MTKTILFFFLSFTLLLSNCKTDNGQQLSNSEGQKFEKNEQTPKRAVDLSYFETEFGWGYNIKINGKNYIHQIHLPCECGGEGFKTKEKAVLAAEFLKQKIENNGRNLQISRTQLDSLGAL